MGPTSPAIASPARLLEAPNQHRTTRAIPITRVPVTRAPMAASCTEGRRPGFEEYRRNPKQIPRFAGARGRGLSRKEPETPYGTRSTVTSASTTSPVCGSTAEAAVTVSPSWTKSCDSLWNARMIGEPFPAASTPSLKLMSSR